MAEPNTTGPPEDYERGGFGSSALDQPGAAGMLADHNAERDSGANLLDQLGALRQQRASETTTDLALPGFAGRLWATVKLPDAGKAARFQTLLGGGAPGTMLLDAALEMVADNVTGIYTSDAGAEPPVLGDLGAVSPGFQHLPGGTDLQPVNFRDARLERVTQLCPPRPHGKAYDPANRVRTLFDRDGLVIAMATSVTMWAIGGGKDTTGALERLSREFVGE